MKKILLLGDSIRRGYDIYVKDAFKNVAEVYYPEDNCRFAAYFLRHLYDWQNNILPERQADVIHWNAGLWDCACLGEDEQLAPPEIYAYYIERICKTMKKLFPEAKIIFATSTPVNEEGYKHFLKRSNADIREYNRIATETAKKYGFAVNDLYSVAEKLSPEAHSDMTHYYTEEGSRAFTQAVNAAIAKELGVDTAQLCEFRYPIEKDTKVIGM